MKSRIIIVYATISCIIFLEGCNKIPTIEVVEVDYANIEAEKRAIIARNENRILFEDNFDYLDKSKWNPNVGFIRNPDIEFQYYSGWDNIAIKDGYCCISLTKTDPFIATFFNENLSLNSVSKEIEYKSGSITTQNIFHYGVNCYVEARLKCDSSPCLWPAFWGFCADCYEGNTMWPNLSEIDIREYLTNPTRSIHFGNDKHYQIEELWNVDGSEWHIYGVKIYNDRLVWVLDNKEVGETLLEGELMQITKARHKIELNLALTGNTSMADGKSMYIDWVRVINLGEKRYSDTINTDQEEYIVQRGERLFIYTQIDDDCADHTVLYESMDETVLSNSIDLGQELDFFNSFRALKTGSTQVKISLLSGLEKTVNVIVI